MPPELNKEEKPGWKTTLRISNIPITTTKEGFCQTLEALTARKSAIDDAKRRRKDNVLTISLAPSASACDSHRYQVATVTFKEVPCDIASRIRVGPAEVAFEADVDTHFGGLTPLNHPSDPCVE